MTFLEILALLCALIGIVGSIVPGIPGPPISWAGLLLAFIAERSSDDPITLTVLGSWLGGTIIVTVLDYVVPAWMTKVTGGHKAASIGAIVGLFAGMFLTPIGMIAGSLLGAFLGEFLVEDNGVWPSFKASIGAFVGFIAGTGLKLIASGWMLLLIIKHIF